jgi:hypothetical protein
MDFEPVLATAAQLLGESDPREYRQFLIDHLVRQGAVHDVPLDHPEWAAIVCVDGGVASEQTDALTWIAAVGVNSANDSDVAAALVIPVGSHAERVRSMVMALCELAAALETIETHGEVWMDGSLATPLISVVTGLLVSDDVTSELICKALADYNADVLFGDFIHYASLGKIRALPKQDTATSYCEEWARQVQHGELAAWLMMQRDRIVATQVLRPGQFLHPRRGKEAARVEAKVPATAAAATKGWAVQFEELLSHWRTDVDAYVTYAVPANSPLRAVKIEYTASSGTDGAEVLELAGTLCGQATESVLGSRILEPLPQHQADRLAKSQVTSLITQLGSAAQLAFRETHPAAVRHYRT